MNLDAGVVLDGRYAIEGVLGTGGMATVYRARHVQLGSYHAIKVLQLPLASIRERLLQEGRVQATLRHPNIVAVTDVIEVQGAPGLVMELVEGMSLDELLQRTQLTIDQIDELARGIIAGVQQAHRFGLIHRDLKPANVMLHASDDGFIPKVTDFGLVKVLSTDDSGSKTRSGATMGTPCYMAPEQIRNAKNADRRSDVFALGAILYELCTGRRAFDGPDIMAIFTAVTTGTYVPVRDLRSDVPDRMLAAIEGALKVDPGERWPDCERLLASWLGADPTPKRSWDPSLLASSRGAGLPTPTAPAEPVQDNTWIEASPSIDTTATAPGSPQLPTEPAKGRSSALSAAPSTSRLLVAAASLSVALVAAASVAAAVALFSGILAPKPAPVVAAPVAPPAPPAPVDGAAAYAQFEGYLDAHRVDFATCSDRRVAPANALNGSVKLALSIGRGDVARVEVVENTTGDPAFAQCVADRVAAWTGLPRALDDAQISVPLTFDLPAIVEVKVPVEPTRPVPARPPPKPPVAEATVRVVETGRLKVNSKPWSEVLLDGTSAGQAGFGKTWDRDLPAGEHVLVLTSGPDGERVEKRVVVPANDTKNFCWDFGLDNECR